MKKFFILLLLIPVLGISQTKNVVSTNRVFPKADKVLEFEKALTVHAQKYHSGDWKWRVFDIQSGPDAGGYHITEGPTSWTAIDGRGNLGADHNTDWNKAVAIYLTDRGSSGYYVYDDSLSTVAVGDYSDKINITHWFQKLGWAGKVRDVLVEMKKTWMASGQTVAVYTSSSSGPSQYVLVTRYKTGLKEREPGFIKGSFKSRYEKENGDDSFDGFIEMLQQYLNEAWSELLFYRADLSSK
jgi:hypothetical protein